MVGEPVRGFTVICSATMMRARPACWFSEVSAASRTVAVVTVLAWRTSCSNRARPEAIWPCRVPVEDASHRLRPWPRRR